MKLIIDIDDNVFTRLFDNGVDTSSEDRKVIDRAVRNGTAYEERPQGDITEEQAIDKLHETGWLPRHDKEMTERPTGHWIPKVCNFYWYRQFACSERK